MSQIAHFIRVKGICPHGCPVIEMADAEGVPIAEGHVPGEHVEQLVADLRRARDDGDASRRPLA